MCVHCVSVYEFYMFDNLSLRFHATYLASLVLVFVVVNFHYLVLIISHLVDNIEGDFGPAKKWVAFPKKRNLEQVARVGQRQTTSNISEHLDIVHGWLVRSIWACSHSSDSLQFLTLAILGARVIIDRHYQLLSSFIELLRNKASDNCGMQKSWEKDQIGGNFHFIIFNVTKQPSIRLGAWRMGP